MIRGLVSRFWNDVEGALTAFTTVSFVLMFLCIGMAVDLMRHEAMRAELQFAVDRGVLAASSMDQTIDERTTVLGYIQSTNFADDASVDLNVQAVKKTDPVKGNIFRRVEATAKYDLDTYFLRLTGINTLNVNVRSVAQQGAQDIELSLVIDVSDSMVKNDDTALQNFLVANLTSDRDNTSGGDTLSDALNPLTFAYGLGWDTVAPSRFEVAKEMSKRFIDNLYDNPFSERTSVSIVPFAGAVNPGTSVFAAMADPIEHSYSECVDLLDTDFDVIPLPLIEQRPQLRQYSSAVFGSDPDLVWGNCPSDESDITYLHNNKDKLKQDIDNLLAADGTATHFGMKWGTALLDPSSRQMINTKIAANEVPAEMAGRPFDYFSGASEKIIVLFSDGVTRPEIRPKDDHYDTSDKIDWLATPGNRMGFDLYGGVVNPVNQGYTRKPQGDGIGALVGYGFSVRADFRNMCDLAKNQGIRIFTVGFQIEGAYKDEAISDLAYCAHDIDHVFITTDAVSLDKALKEIAGFVDVLRLSAK